MQSIPVFVDRTRARLSAFRYRQTGLRLAYHCPLSLTATVASVPVCILANRTMHLLPILAIVMAITLPTVQSIEMEDINWDSLKDLKDVSWDSFKELLQSMPDKLSAIGSNEHINNAREALSPIIAVTLFVFFGAALSAAVGLAMGQLLTTYHDRSLRHDDDEEAYIC